MVFGSAYIEAPDSFLYWSVSDNLFQNGHFIGNYYIEIPDFIVPFGLPVILMLLKLIMKKIRLIILEFILFLYILKLKCL